MTKILTDKNLRWLALLIMAAMGALTFFVLPHYSENNIYDARQIASALLGLMGIWGTWRLGFLFGGAKVGLVAMGLLIATPIYFGLMFVDPLDTALAVGTTWSLYYMGKFFFKSRNSLPQLIKLGVALGFTMAMHIGAIFFSSLWMIAALLDKKQSPKKTLRAIGIVGLVACPLLIALWPFVQNDPSLTNPMVALKSLSEAGGSPASFLYLFDSFAAQLPPLHLSLILIGAAMISHLWRGFPENSPKKPLFVLLITFAVAPVLYASLSHIAFSDGIRRFLFVVPLICVFSALTTKQAAHWLGYRLETPKLGMIAVIGLIVLGAIVHLTTMIKIHPYEYLYVNSLQATSATGLKDYKVDYLSLSDREAVQQLDSFVDSEIKRGAKEQTTYTVAFCGEIDEMPQPTKHLRFVQENELADFLIIKSNSEDCLIDDDQPSAGKEIARIERNGFPLSLVKDLRERSTPKSDEFTDEDKDERTSD